MATKVLQMVCVGSPSLVLLKETEQPLLEHLGVVGVLGKTELSAPTYAFNKSRRQYNANPIMRRLAPLLEPGQSFVLGLADVDLFVPDSPFIFGEADREAKVAIVSIARLLSPSGNPDTLRRRIQVEVVHQVGHLLGLSYCEDSRCVMFLATSMADCDRKGVALCNVCRSELTKLSR